MKFKIVIEEVENGAIFEYPNWDEEGKGLKEKKVFIFDEETLEGLADMLYEIIELLGFSGSKYDKRRIAISMVHGSGYICKDKECRLCKER